MKKILCAAIGLGAIAYTGTAALADSHDLSTTKNSVTFSDLSLVDGSADDGTCAKRYGSGFNTENHPDATADDKKRQSDAGHDILISETGGSIGEGILSLENTYEIVFPDSDNKEPVVARMFATGLLGSNQVSGVFSDGTCRGKVTIQAAAAQ